MSSIFDARQEEIIFVQLEREPLFSEDLRDARKIIKQCWDVVGVDKCVIYNCLLSQKILAIDVSDGTQSFVELRRMANSS